MDKLKQYVENPKLQRTDADELLHGTDFVRIPKALLGEVSTTAVLLYAYLTERWDMDTDGNFRTLSGERFCYYTIDDMAVRLGVSYQTATKAKKELIECGAIRTERESYTQSAHRIYRGTWMSGQYAPLPRLLTREPYRSLISNNERVVYAVYLDKCLQSEDNDFTDERGVYCYITADEISDITGISKRAVMTAKKHLTDAGLIHTERAGRDPRLKAYIEPIGIWPRAWREQYPHCTTYMDMHEDYYGDTHDGITAKQVEKYEEAIAERLYESQETNYPASLPEAIERFFGIDADHNLAVFATGDWIKYSGFEADYEVGEADTQDPPKSKGVVLDMLHRIGKITPFSGEDTDYYGSHYTLQAIV